MSTAEQFPPIRTVDEFLAWEEAQPERYEFVGGAVRMMVGARGVHNTIAFNLRTALHARRPAGCRAYSESFKLLVGKDVLYPDVLLTCDPEAPHKTATSHALLTAEVLSPSSVRDDNFRKKTLYLTVPTLRHYLVVSAETVQVEVYSRHEAGPPTVAFYDRLAQSVDLPGLGMAVPMADIYQDTDLPEDIGPFRDRRESEE